MNSDSNLNATLERLPHAGPMRFIDGVVDIRDGGRTIETQIVVRETFIMARGAHVSPFVAIEYFAQSAAALMAYRSEQAAAPKVSGALLGTRKIDCFTTELRVGDVLRCTATEIFGVGALAQFECTLSRDGEVVAEGSINVASAALPD